MEAVARMGAIVKRDQAEALALRAAADARLDLRKAETLAQDRVRERLRVFRNLMDQAREEEAFRQAHGLQCGFCTPGFVVTVQAFLQDNPNPTLDEIKEGLSGNLCRCTGYQGIIKAVQIAAETMSPQSA